MLNTSFLSYITYKLFNNPIVLEVNKLDFFKVKATN